MHTPKRAFNWWFECEVDDEFHGKLDTTTAFRNHIEM